MRDKPNPTMSISQPDPTETEIGAFDDRNLKTDEDFEMDDNLAFNIGYGGRDPADDGGY
jgi:hypothetical protein